MTIPLLCWARLLVTFVPFSRWQHSLGGVANHNAPRPHSTAKLADAQRFARHVDRAAAWLPFPILCLPRAMALSWTLRRRRIGHTVVFAVRPEHLRNDADALHAWVEISRTRIMGDLPGPWLETLRLGE